MGLIKERLINYAVAVIFILFSPCLLVDVLEYRHFEDRENLIVLITSVLMTTIYSFGMAYIIGFLLQGAGL